MFLLFTLIVMSNIVFGVPITQQDAETVATNWYSNQTSQVLNVGVK